MCNRSAGSKIMFTPYTQLKNKLAIEKENDMSIIDDQLPEHSPHL